jgi:hypothetical protein
MLSRLMMGKKFMNKRVAGGSWYRVLCKNPLPAFVKASIP